ncbi:MAG: glucose-6-phosphate isomerase [Desulfuromonadaceae bacterium]|nr:glucose-6-phosphate isomerase [Desulfuromonadaceae bacterium]MDD2847026.1 glucose-6-phosphate isomerase [Desulfuromonadaceae bacterium]MDD4128996.1 glucose-6-phosphate isomerase [Desulfuromonadaceae bacterium]
MNNDTILWNRYKKDLCYCPEIGLSLDISRMKFSDVFFAEMEPAMQGAFAEMHQLEGGAIANRDEGRMVGHYWLRKPSLSPTPEIRHEIEAAIEQTLSFSSKIHSGAISAQNSSIFRNVLIIGIGGSALGPQFVADALTCATDRMKTYFLDNTDPDGFDKVFTELGASISQTLTLVISKSGSTKETRNGMLETKAAYQRAGLDFSQHAVAVTGLGSELDRLARAEGWLERFPMWDWVGGRTSVTSAVGLLPAALQGIDIRALLEGAKACDAVTSKLETTGNPAAVMALMWHYATDGRGTKDLVMLPYKDRLLLFSRYLQQLIMESIGKERDRDGVAVKQGLTVYGNKGSTDQHAYVQQLRDGVANFFITFIEVLRDRDGSSMLVEDGVTSGDFLFGFFQGTRAALYENGRESMTITINQVDAYTVGVLIALFERAVGFYASVVNINAYHQPGVEAGKKAAGAVIALQKSVMELLQQEKRSMTAEAIADLLGKPEEAEMVFAILRHLAANPDRGVIQRHSDLLTETTFRIAE